VVVLELVLVVVQILLAFQEDLVVVVPLADPLVELETPHQHLHHKVILVELMQHHNMVLEVEEHLRQALLEMDLHMELLVVMDLHLLFLEH
jgi:hypothetical protein